MLGAALLAGVAGRVAGALLPVLPTIVTGAVVLLVFGTVYLGSATLLGLPEAGRFLGRLRRR
jgi:hypothetical protein